MNLAEIAELLDKAGVPVAYAFFPDDQGEPEPPYITYEEVYTSNIGADNQVYKKVIHVDIILYTSKKDLEHEAKIEGILDDASIFYDCTEDYDSGQKVYRKIYEVSIYG